MKLIKSVFIISLVNFALVLGVVWTSRGMVTEGAVVIPTAIPKTDPLAGKCLVYINGVRYDMTNFKKLHGGGDVFKCGADMTEIFRAQHQDSYLGKIARYKI